jgi:hypothetical protein
VQLTAPNSSPDSSSSFGATVVDESGTQMSLAQNCLTVTDQFLIRLLYSGVRHSFRRFQVSLLSLDEVERNRALAIHVTCWNKTKKLKTVALRPQANYTDRATAACRRSLCQLLRINGVTWSAQLIPTAVNLGFLDRSRYFSIQVAPQLSSRG